MTGDDRQKPETEIEVPGSYHRYYGDDHYGDRPGGGHVPEELWRVLRRWDASLRDGAGRRPRAVVRLVLAVAAGGVVAALLYGIFG